VPSHSRLRGLVSLTSEIASPDVEKIDAGGAVRTESGRSIFGAGDGPPNFFVVSTDQRPPGEGIGSPRACARRTGTIAVVPLSSIASPRAEG
jgi:hypothetical protein